MKQANEQLTKSLTFDSLLDRAYEIHDRTSDEIVKASSLRLNDRGGISSRYSIYDTPRVLETLDDLYGVASDEELYKKGFNCMHARRGDMNLRNDEVVFYNESAPCIKYLVEFGV